MTGAGEKTILIVDDEPDNVLLVEDMLEVYLERWRPQCLTAADGLEALEILRVAGGRIDAVLLDQRMPRMSGIDVLLEMRRSPLLSGIPVVLQSAVRGASFEAEALSAGATYLLEKPYTGPLLASVLEEILTLEDDRQGTPQIQPPASERYLVRTLADARSVAAAIAQLCPRPERARPGIYELLVNGIEHGNLQMAPAEKSRLSREGRWEAEIARRSGLPEHAGKRVEVRFERHSGENHLWIGDSGPGFDWRSTTSPALGISGFPPHSGRGITLARILSFD